jgi:polysaccharide export outer membrane protein
MINALQPHTVKKNILLNQFLKLFIFIASTILLTSSFKSFAYAAVSQAQIEQFKKLPPAQQAMLAKQMGVDVNSLKKQMASNDSDTSTQNTGIFPRGTQFDLQGNPLLEEQVIEDQYSLQSSDQLQAFGYDVFANAPQTFAPMMDIAIPANYIIGPGDKISVQIFGKEKQDMELAVNREGQVTFPAHGPITVSGLSFVDMKKLLTSTIKEKIIGVDVAVGIASLRSMRVFVLGDAFKPGPYTLSSLSSMTHAIFAAGGVSDIGSLRNIQLKRAGKLISTLDLYDLLIHGDSRGDLLLQSGDVIFVAPKGDAVSIEGEVRRPAIYELNGNNNFKDVLAMAGGLLPTAFAKTTRVERYNQDALRSVLNLDLLNTNDLAKKVNAGDAIHVMQAAKTFQQSVTLIGAVTRPGMYQWQIGQRITDILPSINANLLQSADVNYGLIVREVDYDRNIEILQFDLAKAIAFPELNHNPQLQPNDKVLIFSNLVNVSEQQVTLDSLAYTEEKLIKKEQDLAKEKFKEKQFWLKYGDSQKMQELEANELDSVKLTKQSIAEFSGGKVEEELDLTKLNLFSRQRLLLPIIEQLKRQGKSGQPILLVEADGEVKYPGIYPLAKNARIGDLINAAGGLTESAYLSRAEITRNVITNNTAQVSSVAINLAEALTDNSDDNILLSSKDRLNVHQIPAWSENNVVELRGEFVFPGKYTVRRGESLADLIEKAGGFTPFAYQQGSVFTRVQLRNLERQNLLKLTADLRVEMASKSMSDENFTQDYADMKQMLADMANVQPVGRLVLDLPKLIAEANYDVALEAGDVLYVPTKKNAVNVIGQVQVTSSHMYDNTLSAEDYLAQSGGSKKRADEDRIYIIAANGSIRMLDEGNWFTNSADNKLQPGDTIVVPLDAEYMNNLALWSSVTTIVYNTAVAIAAISGI